MGGNYGKHAILEVSRKPLLDQLMFCFVKQVVEVVTERGHTMLTADRRIFKGKDATAGWKYAVLRGHSPARIDQNRYFCKSWLLKTIVTDYTTR